MAQALLLLGSNDGDRKNYLENARFRISVLTGKLTTSSSIYETAPWGKEDQPPFLNQVVALETTLAPNLLLAALQAIEMSLGRISSPKWTTRTIDIDILFYDHQIIDALNLTVPHPAITQRRFTLVPLSEIAPNFIHPTLKKTIATLLLECTDTLPVEKSKP